MKNKTFYKILWAIVLLFIAGVAMTYSLRFDDYDNIQNTFGTTATGRLAVSPAIFIVIVAIGIFVITIFPIKKMRTFSTKKKLLVGIGMWFLLIFLIFAIIAITLLFQIYIFDFLSLNNYTVSIWMI